MNTAPNLELFFQDFVLPEFGIAESVTWERHLKTHPDNFLHMFTIGEVKYALAFDDYPSSFSVGHDKSVKSIKLSNGEEVLHVSASLNKYVENITGAFMLFQVTDAEPFEVLLNYLEASYRKLQKKWQSESRDVIVIARDVLQLAETAAQNHDSGALYSLKNLVETFNGLEVEDNDIHIGLLNEYIDILLDEMFGYEDYTEEDKTRVQGEVYQSLSSETQDSINIQKYDVTNLGQTVRLLTAMYSKENAGKTEGISITIIFDGDEVRYPLYHFIDDELKKYFAENAYIVKSNVHEHMPETLKDYRLVAGSVEVRDVFKRELEYISY